MSRQRAIQGSDPLKKLPGDEFYEYKALYLEIALIKQQAQNKIAALTARQDKIVEMWKAQYGPEWTRIDLVEGCLLEE